MNPTHLKISTKQAENIVYDLFRIKGSATELPGELDTNFRIKVKNHQGYILKISRSSEDENYLDFQQKILLYIEKNSNLLIAPRVITDKHGQSIASFTDDSGDKRNVRLLSWVSGRVWNSVSPQLNNLRLSLGKQCGLLTKALSGFDHPQAHRSFDWDVAQSLWTCEYLHLFEKEKRKIITSFQKKFKLIQHSYHKLRKAVVHNDANDHNVIVSNELINPSVLGVIDYGDACYTQIINDLSICCAYGIMEHNDPLSASLPIVKGYHSTFPLEESELEHLFYAIAMRLVITVTKSAINRTEAPDNRYLLISETPAWELLNKWYLVDKDFAHYSFRKACGYEAHPYESKFRSWATNNKSSLLDLFPTINKNKIYSIDLSVSSQWIGHEIDYNDVDLFQFKINKLQNEHSDKIIAGGYLEPRIIYPSSTYERIGNKGRESRTIHLGIDFWLPAGTAVHALFDGEIVLSAIDYEDKGYGGLIIVKHCVSNIEFYTLYGHLSWASTRDKHCGERIKKGENIGYLGTSHENGSWAPHLHFQILLSMLGNQNNFPGVAYHSEWTVWQSLCPNPNLLFQSLSLRPVHQTANIDLIQFRKRHLGKSLSLLYDNPIKMVRGQGQYLIDQFGKKHLDTVNNVAHVGHEHPSVVKAGRDQMSLINTNSRYLHDQINELTKELLETLPSELSVLHFVNSGSEANELAIRMVKATTGHRDIIASEVGYHGNSNMCIDISSYKFDGKGGSGIPEYTHIIPLPDSFRGKYTTDNFGHSVGVKYAEEVRQQVKFIQSKKRNVGAFIIEPIISCGGQIDLPKGFLAKSYEYVREAGGLCISDEIQVGCGRLGKVFWGFELHNVIPDIVTIGKPLGNGHPLAAVACTEAVADQFANGMEYFNTFGGNPVSCAIGAEVIKTIKRENLQENAQRVGHFLKSQLIQLAHQFPLIGDVRGEGLFLGIELVDADKNPLTLQADYLVNRMKDYGILMSADGPDHNVLKIKPPLVFTQENAEELLYFMNVVFNEDVMNVG